MKVAEFIKFILHNPFPALKKDNEFLIKKIISIKVMIIVINMNYRVKI